MEMQHWTYSLLLAGSVLIPLMRSFEPRVHFVGTWKALFWGIAAMMLVFIPWDIAFTSRGVWGFSHEYVAGIYLLGLPLEEWLFFVVIPYCVVFSYEVIRYFFPRIWFPRIAFYLFLVLGVGLIAAGLLFSGRLYTMIVTILTGSLMLLQLLLRNHRRWLSPFLIAWLVTLLPFFIVNGVLTALPVVWYDNQENLGLRLGTIPVEDSAYFMSMMLIVMMVYEPLKKRASGK